MLSVVVYGRNDAHGYNLHKRTAIGLNAVAELLDDRDDEILFVDYNTPDDHPTVIEAIRDTLTDRCLGRLRVLRVRPAQHRRWQDLTPYPVLEAVARNVAVRRSNPANRWILSTNPDMVFVPRGGVPSLSVIAAQSPDGFYQTPRFELPETLWETFDRRAPAATIEWLAKWGRRLHVNELVHTGPVTRFDGIGDFQLILRDDWFAIHGCHEGMIHGSNVDMNLCVRLNRLRGGTGSLSESVFAFHCGHGRQATLIHADDTLMNDHIRFVETVEEPYLPHQADVWGLAGEEVEAFAAADPPGSRFIPVLTDVLPGLEAAYGEAWNDHLVAFRLRYDPEHALPYLLNHLINVPRSTVIGWIGGQARMLALFRKAWRRLGGGRLLVAESMPLTVPDDLDASYEEAAAIERIGREADILVFEFGLDDTLLSDEEPDPWFAGITPARHDALGRLKGAFQRLCARERQRMARGLPPRKIVAVNAINTYCGLLVEAEIRFVRIPFSCRVQHGFVRPDGPAVFLPRGQTDLGAFLTKALDRTPPVDRYEAAIVNGDLARLREANLEEVDPRVFSQPLLAALDWSGTDLTPERRQAIRATAARRRPSAEFRPLLASATATAAAVRPAGPPAPDKLAAAEDWEDAGWFARAHQYTIEGLSYHASTCNYFKRSRGVWERVQILHALACLRDLGPDDDVAVVCTAPDGLPLFLADRVRRVDLIAAAPCEDAGWLAKRRLFHPDYLRIHANGRDGVPSERRWAAVLLPQNVIMASGWDGFADWLAWAEEHLQEGGVLAFSAEVALTPGAGPAMMTARQAGVLATIVAAHTGLRPVGAFDLSLSDATLDRVAQAGPGMDKPHLVASTGGVLHTCGVWALRRQATAVASHRAQLVGTLRNGEGYHADTDVPVRPRADGEP